MGLFGFGKHDAPASNESVPQSTAPSMGILNLEKDAILDLSKDVEASLKSMRVSAGWDVNAKGRDFDLDLCAFLVDANGKLINSANSVVYYGEKKSNGVKLDGDNLTGAGAGDDENIFLSLEKVPQDCQAIKFYVIIYGGASRGQYFGEVRNAYVRLVNTENRPEKELCRYSLSEDGGKNTAIYFCELSRNSGNWNFKAVGEYLKASIEDIKRTLR